MLFTVSHVWLSGACFVFNCFHHWSLLVLKNRDRVASLLHSSEGVTQGGPLAMFSYGFGVLLFIKKLRSAYPDVTQIWYDDNAGALSMYGDIGLYFNFPKII